LTINTYSVHSKGPQPLTLLDVLCCVVRRQPETTWEFSVVALVRVDPRDHLIPPPPAPTTIKSIAAMFNYEDLLSAGEQETVDVNGFAQFSKQVSKKFLQGYLGLDKACKYHLSMLFSKFLENA
jgi:hypothetical protein